ncbi:MAG: DNA-directed RNA polymerase subunit beta' [Candidatus Nealsonbacteria bacterium]|nr:DNA-directed RNA polymerase subunit beta' [Candidatus Nealsonbacteria bacterium]
MRVIDLESIRIKLTSPEEILVWSHGEVTKPETINYRTQKPEKDGLFCEKIFGPEKDYECYCGKYRKIRYKGIVCDKCGVEVTKASVRRERMGHIKLAVPCSHIWFLRGVPSRIGLVLDIPMQQLERIIYFASYIITKVNEDAKSKILGEIESEYKSKAKSPAFAKVSVSAKAPADKSAGRQNSKTGAKELKDARDRAREEVISIKPLKVLSEIEYNNFSLKYGEIFEAGTGAETLRKIFQGLDLKKILKELGEEQEKTSPINRRKILRRTRIIRNMLRAGVRPEWMFLTILPILPPDLRPMVQLDGGRYASSDLNDLYRRVINRNNRLKYLLEINAPEVIVRNEKRMLQEAVDALIDNSMRKGQTTTATTGGKRLLKSLADILKGKQGRFRQNLLGKRVDYSGRSVIVVGPELRLHQCGIPKKMALELFKPFVIKKILDKELAYNVRGASRLIDETVPEVWAILEEIVKDKLVLLNRAPTLHRLGIQAFQPVLMEGNAIRIHPLVCKAFNADFDGDQMAVHVPLSEEAQREAREIMLSTLNLLKPATGSPVIAPVRDIVLGAYWMTKIVPGLKGEGKIFGSKNEAILALDTGIIDIRAKIKVRINNQLFETSVGRVLFNNTLPRDFAFQNEDMNSKKMEKLTAKLIENYDREIVESALDKMKNLGFEYSTIAGITWGMDDLTVPPGKEKLMQEAQKQIEILEEHYKKGLLSKEEKTAQAIAVWQKTKVEIEKMVTQTLPQLGSVMAIIDSGARGTWSQVVQMTGMKGLVTNPAGAILELPVKSSFKEGFDVLEYFISTHGARKGTADTALRTSAAGYLTRRLVDVAHEMIVSQEDCKDQTGVSILKDDADAIGQNLIFKIIGRVILEDIKGICKVGEIIDGQIANKIIDSGIKQLRVRSPLSCKTVRGLCQKCYGWDLGSSKLVKLGEAVGIVAAQAIGEPGTQLTMRTFHTGGVAEGGDITQGLPRVEEIFESRIPVGKAVISQVDGKVMEITPERIIRIKSEIQSIQSETNKKNSKSKKEKTDIVEYQIPPKKAIWIEVGQGVKRGQQLCEGHLDLKELFKTLNKEEVQRYITKEIQKIYVSQGAVIHDKHVEVIAKQMFSRVRVKDAGDSYFSIGQVMERAKVIEENTRLKKEKKALAVVQPVLLGISKVALTTDSFLSAASFQETSRVLIRAAIEAQEDKLQGLKENVIIGKLIPAGTGFHKKE